eukprot:SAG31_NODE_7632_length_1634_cov_1.851466_3_plen_173_part_01
MAAVVVPFWIFAIFFCFMFIWFIAIAGVGMTIDTILFVFPGVTACLVNIPCLLAWWFSLKIASVLAEDTVMLHSRRSHVGSVLHANLRSCASSTQIDDAIELIQRHSVQSAEWNTIVVPAVHGLVMNTLPTLSAGWGISLGLVFAAAVPASFSYVNLYLWWGSGLSVGMAVGI